MRLHGSRLVIHGAVGGIIAGAFVAAWFFVVDLLAGQLFATPVILAGTILGRDVMGTTVGVVASYTLLHFGVFIVLGVGAAWGMGQFGITPGLRHGALFGVGLLNAVHYGVLLVVDAEMLTALSPIHVLAANLFGGMALTTYLHRASRAETPLGLAAIRGHKLFWEGLIVGLVGAAAVALWFLVLDIITARPFFTPAALGAVFFSGASSADEVQLGLGVIVAYTGLHVAAFIAVGVVFVWVAERIEHAPGLWLLAVMAFIVMEGGFLATLGLFGSWVLGAVGWWAVIVGNLLAVGAMGRFIWRTHPTLRKRLTEEPVATMV